MLKRQKEQEKTNEQRHLAMIEKVNKQKQEFEARCQQSGKDTSLVKSIPTDS